GADLMASTDELLTELLAVAQEQLRWQRASVLPEVCRTIETALTTTQLQRAFEMCDVTNASTDIAKAVGTSPQSLSRWTGRWRDGGPADGVSPDGAHGNRARHRRSRPGREHAQLRQGRGDGEGAQPDTEHPQVAGVRESRGSRSARPPAQEAEGMTDTSPSKL